MTTALSMATLAWLSAASSRAADRFELDIQVCGPNTEGVHDHGETLARATFALACDGGAEPGTTVCSLVGDQARVHHRADEGRGPVQVADVAVDPEVTFELTWRDDGRLKRFRPHGPKPGELMDWISVGTAALAVPRPPGGWDQTTPWIHRGPAVMSLAGYARLMAAQLELRTTERTEAHQLLAVSGSGQLDGHTVALLSEGASDSSVQVQAEGTVVLDPDHRLKARRLSLWLIPRDNAIRGNLGSQRVVVRRLETPPPG